MVGFWGSGVAEEEEKTETLRESHWNDNRLSEWNHSLLLLQLLIFFDRKRTVCWGSADSVILEGSPSLRGGAKMNLGRPLASTAPDNLARLLDPRAPVYEESVHIFQGNVVLAASFLTAGTLGAVRRPDDADFIEFLLTSCFRGV
ncbi:hypothetical protein E2C01_058473 [Portunus trituberculatus]|uniref:Uncharacterized protein n=1 Tax=Portunus trituberculatus TaxID=210409 RepID=A0A5B7H331_PORTR|nr:hypothetical protein [Portunus trituberculatus]